MRFKSLLFLAFVTLSIASCKRLDKLITFTLETNDRVVWPFESNSVLGDTIPDNNIISILSGDFKFSNYEKFETNKSTPQSVEEVEKWDVRRCPENEKGCEPLAMSIEIDSGANTFSFMQDLKVFLVSPNGLFPETELYSQADSQPVENIIEISNTALVPDNDFFLSAMQKDGYKFRTEYKLIGLMPDTVKLNYKMKFRIKALPDE
jgi:hypothetical protein